MTFEQALPLIRKGKYIKREKWLDCYAFTWGRKNDWCCSGFLTISGCAGNDLKDEDIMANDWIEIIKKG